MQLPDWFSALAPILLILAIGIPLISAVIKLLATTHRPTRGALDAEAAAVGQAGAEKQEKKVAAVFQDFRDMENL